MTISNYNARVFIALTLGVYGLWFLVPILHENNKAYVSIRSVLEDRQKSLKELWPADRIKATDQDRDAADDLFRVVLECDEKSVAGQLTNVENKNCMLNLLAARRVLDIKINRIAPSTSK